MKTIWKFPLDGEEQTVSLPAGAQILCVHEQLGRICLWAEVDPEEPSLEYRRFWIVGTGEPRPRSGKYLGTSFIGNYVWHVFVGS
jgi:hypothetical protein